MFYKPPSLQTIRTVFAPPRNDASGSMSRRLAYGGLAMILWAILPTAVARTGESPAAGQKPSNATFQFPPVLEVIRDQEAAWNDGDIDRFMQHYCKSDRLTFSSGGTTTRGWENTMANYRRRYPTKEKMGRVRFDNLEVFSLGDTAALVLGEFFLKRQSDPLRGNFSLVFEKIDGRWVIIHDHTSRATEKKKQTLPAAHAAEGEDEDLERFIPNHGNTVYECEGLLRRWPAEGPKELWRVEIGFGKSAVVEAGGLAFTATETDDKQWAVCLDPATGATRWKHLLLPKKNRHVAWGPVTSPVIDGDRVYFIPYAIKGKDLWELRCPIVCVKTDGTELWRVDKTVWATEASTPLVVDDTLYVAADNPQRVVLVALDKMTGKLRWSTVAESDKERELGAPSSLTYQVVDGIPQVIVATYGTREILGVHAGTGEIMWRYPYPAELVVGLISTPVAVGSRLFVCAGEGKGRDFSACLEMQAVDGKIACRELYRSTELQTNNYNTVAVYDGGVFGFGGNDRAGFLHCTNFEDGRLLWKQDGDDWTRDQNLIVAGGLIFALTKNDELVMAEASRTGYRELGRFSPGIELGKPQQPTLANGRIYLRGKKAVVCYQVAK